MPEPKYDVINWDTKPQVMAYCKTCNTEIDSQERYDMHYDGGCVITPTHTYVGIHNGRELAAIFCRLVNSQDRASLAKGFMEGMKHEHRTLQAHTMMSIREIVILYGKLSNNDVDGRNEHERNICKKMGDAW